MTSYTAHTDTFARDNLPPRDLWPEFIFRLTELKYPARMNCATELLDKPVTRGHGHRIALRSPEGECSYTQLFTQANRLANVLVHEMVRQAPRGRAGGGPAELPDPDVHQVLVRRLARLPRYAGTAPAAHLRQRADSG
jgi:hypothetical protein